LFLIFDSVLCPTLAYETWGNLFKGTVHNADHQVAII